MRTRDQVGAGRLASTENSADRGGAESSMPDQPRPALRIVSGRPSAEELAAVSAVLSAVSAGVAADEPVAQVGGWSDLGRRLRRPLPAGPGAWRNSSWQ